MTLYRLPCAPTLYASGGNSYGYAGAGVFISASL